MFGAVVERDSFRFSRRLPDAKTGVTTLTLDAHALALSNDLRDLRIVDERDRQIPYVLDRQAPPLLLDLDLGIREKSGSRSVYRFDLPYAGLPPASIILTTNARAFAREVRVRQHRGRSLASASWRSDPADSLSQPFRLELPRRAPRRLELEIDEGDNEPLAIESVKIELAGASLRFIHPGTTLDLLYGNRGLGEPRYDLALLSGSLSGGPAHEVRLGAAPPTEDEREGRKLFWIGIVFAAVVLVALLLRLVLVRPETSRAPADST